MDDAGVAQEQEWGGDFAGWAKAFADPDRCTGATALAIASVRTSSSAVEELELDLAERRRQPRFLVGLPVRLFVDGVPTATTVELRDVSAGGGFLCTDDITPAVLTEQHVAIGFVLPSLAVGLARGRVRRIVNGLGFAVVFDQANDAFQGFVHTLVGSGGLPA